jgi:hypothetical protein
VKLSSPATGAIVDDTAVVTITDDDAGTPAGFRINDVVRNEGSGSSTMTFTINRVGDTGEAVSVTAASATATSPFLPAATAGTDFTSVPATVVAFAIGETSKTVSVTIATDSLIEGNEFLFLNLSSQTRARLLDSRGVGTIADDDH